MSVAVKGHNQPWGFAPVETAKGDIMKKFMARAGDAIFIRQHRRHAVSVLLAAVLLLAFAAVPSVGFADDDDHDRARQALLAGKVMSLRDVLDNVMRDYPGEPVEIDFEDDDGIYLYEIKLLQPAGNIVKLKVDARTGEVVGMKGRGVQFKGND